MAWHTTNIQSVLPILWDIFTMRFLADLFFCVRVYERMVWWGQQEQWHREFSDLFIWALLFGFAFTWWHTTFSSVVVFFIDIVFFWRFWRRGFRKAKIDVQMSNDAKLWLQPFNILAIQNSLTLCLNVSMVNRKSACLSHSFDRFIIIAFGVANN